MFTTEEKKNDLSDWFESGTGLLRNTSYNRTWEKECGRSADVRLRRKSRQFGLDVEKN